QNGIGVNFAVKAQYKNLIFVYGGTIGARMADHRPARLKRKACFAGYWLIGQRLKRRVKLDAAADARPWITGEFIRPAPVIEPAPSAFQFRIVTSDLHRRRRLPIAKCHDGLVERQLDAFYLGYRTLRAELGDLSGPGRRCT